MSNFLSELWSKRLGLLRELLPATTAITTLVNPDFQDAERQVEEMEAAAHGLELQLIVLRARNERQIDAAFATMAQQGDGPLLVHNDPFFLALCARLTPRGMWFAQTVAGHLASHAANVTDV